MAAFQNPLLIIKHAVKTGIQSRFKLKYRIPLQQFSAVVAKLEHFITHQKKYSQNSPGNWNIHIMFTHLKKIIFESDQLLMFTAS